MENPIKLIQAEIDRLPNYGSNQRTSDYLEGLYKALSILKENTPPKGWDLVPALEDEFKPYMNETLFGWEVIQTIKNVAHGDVQPEL